MSPDVEPPRKVLAYLDALGGALPPSLPLLGLLRGAWRSGFVHAAQEPASAASIARRAGTDPARAVALADALVAFEVLDRTDAGYVVSAAWRPLLLAEPPTPFESQLAFVEASSRMLENVASGGPTYWDGDDAARVAYAVGVAPDPESRGALEVAGFLLAQDPELHRMVSAGGRYLELGCGTAGTLLCQLQLHPQLTAVGVELDPALAAVARERAERLGVAHRLRVVCGDARDFSDPEPFDFGAWSQFFFPEEARAGALATAFGSLKPGGVLSAPLLTEPVSAVDDLRTDDGRAAATTALLHQGWGVPHRSKEQLFDELLAAGFTEPRLQEVGFARVVRAIRP